MRVHPVLLCLEGQPCVVIGADGPAVEKANAVARSGARVTMFGEPAAAHRESLSESVEVRPRPYEEGDLRGSVLAYASTRDPELIARLRAEAARERVLLNVIDVPDACAFISPAVVRRGDFVIAIGTGGASPALSARVRAQLERDYGPEYETYVSILGAVRQRFANSGERARLISGLVDSPLLDLIREGNVADVDALLRQRCGDDCALDRLGVAFGEGGGGR